MQRASPVQWTHHTLAAPVQNVSVNHRSGNIRMAEQFLHGADVIAGLQQVRSKRMAQSVRCGGFSQLSIAHRLFHRALHALFIHMMAAGIAGARINRQIPGRENILMKLLAIRLSWQTTPAKSLVMPAPFAPGIRIFLVQRKRQIHLAASL